MTALMERVPIGRLKPAPWNPRLIKDSRFKNLCKSLQADPDFMERRPILASSDGTIYGGNMRWRAAQHIGWETVPAIIDDIPEHLAKERALKDNNQFGEWQDQELAEVLVELQMGDSDLNLLGFDDKELHRLLDSVGALGEPDFVPVGEDEQGRLDQKKPVQCPECGCEFVPSA